MRAPLSFLLALGSLLIVCDVQAGSGLVLRGRSVTEGSLEPLIPLPNGVMIQTLPVALAVTTLDYEDTGLLVYELTSSRAYKAEVAVGAIHLTSISEALATLDELLSEPGAVAYFESPGPVDPERSEHFWVYRPSQGAVLYRLPGIVSEFGGTGPVCGNGTCESGESCDTCSADCGECGPVCGNGVCQPGETCASCASDCGVCPPPCGDVTLDHAVTGADVTLYRRYLANPDPLAGIFNPGALDRCSVIGAPTSCTILDLVVLRRHLAGLAPFIAQVCSAAP
ncbi:MAG: hypothetical protein ACE5FG_08595 [Myxococcota bacterium]